MREQNLKKINPITRLTGFIPKLNNSRQDHNQQKSDRIMLGKVVRLFVLLFFVLFMFDELLDLFLGFFQVLYDLIHLFGEALEYGFELALENTLHIDHHSSETIIVNIAMIFGLYGLYRFIRSIPTLLLRVKRNFRAFYLKRQRRARFYWRSLPIPSKFKLLMAYFVGIASIMFVITL